MTHLLLRSIAWYLAGHEDDIYPDGQRLPGHVFRYGIKSAFYVAVGNVFPSPPQLLRALNCLVHLYLTGLLIDANQVSNDELAITPYLHRYPQIGVTLAQLVEAV